MRERLRRLQPAVQAVLAREEAMARELAESERQLGEQEARLRQLLGFRGEYGERLRSDGREGIAARRLQDYTAFLSNLDRSIAQAFEQLQRLRDRTQAKRQDWMSSRARRQALEEVMRRYRLELSRAWDRREQAESDAWALRGRRLAAED